MTVPAVVIAEWHRSSTSERWRANRDFLASCDIEPLDRALATLAGQALAAVPGVTTIHAIVAASAARRGDIILTSDVDDFDRLRAEHFRAVSRVQRV
jgi:predicted nucleic acid-binding protein